MWINKHVLDNWLERRHLFMHGVEAKNVDCGSQLCGVCYFSRNSYFPSLGELGRNRTKKKTRKSTSSAGIVLS